MEIQKRKIDPKYINIMRFICQKCERSLRQVDPCLRQFCIYAKGDWHKLGWHRLYYNSDGKVIFEFYEFTFSLENADQISEREYRNCECVSFENSAVSCVEEWEGIIKQRINYIIELQHKVNDFSKRTSQEQYQHSNIIS